MTPAYTFEVAGPPVPWSRVRTGKGTFFNTAKMTNAKSRVAWEAKAAGVRMIDGAVSLCVTAVFEPPKSWSKVKKHAALDKAHTFKPDADNLGKLVKDALCKVAYADDSQVAELAISKRYGPQAKTVISLRGME